MIKQIPIFSEEGGVGFDELMIVNKINEIIGFCNSLPQTEEKFKCYGCWNNKECENLPQEKLDIVPSPRIDWCVECKKEHEYDCPKDIDVEALMKEYKELARQEITSALDDHEYNRMYQIISLFKSLQGE